MKAGKKGKRKEKKELGDDWMSQVEENIFFAPSVAIFAGMIKGKRKTTLKWLKNKITENKEISWK